MHYIQFLINKLFISEVDSTSSTAIIIHFLSISKTRERVHLNLHTDSSTLTNGTHWMTWVRGERGWSRNLSEKKKRLTDPSWPDSWEGV